MSSSPSAELLAQVPAGLVDQFRKQFHAKCKKEIEGTDSSSSFDSRDVETMLDDVRIRGYLTVWENDIDVSVKNVRDMFLFRNEWKVRDLKYSDFPPTMMRGHMFFRNKDRDGNNIFWFRIRFNKKGVQNSEKKRFFAYLLEQHYQKFPGERVTFVFDLSDSGLGQTDLDVLRFMINCFQANFPFIVNNLLVYKMPWILEGIWSIVKQWLSARAREKVKFVSGDAVDQYISKENRFLHMAGGLDSFNEIHGDGDKIFVSFSELYVGTPRIGSHNMSFSSVANNSTTADASICETVTMDGTSTVVSASASGISLVNTPPRSPITEMAAEATGLDPKVSPRRKPSNTSSVTPTKPAVASEPPVRLNRSVSSNLPLLEFSPDNSLIFDKKDSSSDIIEASIYLRNVSGGVIAFKVKSTSMTRYRSRPCAGFIHPNHLRHLHISCRAEDTNFLSTDRFLIQYMQVSEAAVEEAGRAGSPPSVAASKVLSAKPAGERLFERRFIPSVSDALKQLSNGNAVAGTPDKTHATPTPTLNNATRDGYLRSNGDALAQGGGGNNEKMLAKIHEEVTGLRRRLGYMTAVVFLQLIAFVAYIVVFQLCPDKFHTMTDNIGKGFKN